MTKFILTVIFLLYINVMYSQSTSIDTILKTISSMEFKVDSIQFNNPICFEKLSNVDRGKILKIENGFKLIDLFSFDDGVRVYLIFNECLSNYESISKTSNFQILVYSKNSQKGIVLSLLRTMICKSGNGFFKITFNTNQYFLDQYKIIVNDYFQIEKIAKINLLEGDMVYKSTTNYILQDYLTKIETRFNDDEDYIDIKLIVLFEKFDKKNPKGNNLSKIFEIENVEIYKKY